MARQANLSRQHRVVLEKVDRTLTARTAERLGIPIESLIAAALTANNPVDGMSAEEYQIEADRFTLMLTQAVREGTWEEPDWLSTYCKSRLNALTCTNPECRKEFRIGTKGVFSRTYRGVTQWFCCFACYEVVSGTVMTPKLTRLIAGPVLQLVNGNGASEESEEDEMAQLDRALKTTLEEIANARKEGVKAIEDAQGGAHKLINDMMEEARNIAGAIKRDEQAALQRLAEAERRLTEAGRILQEATTLQQTLNGMIAAARESLPEAANAALLQALEPKVTEALAALNQRVTEAIERVEAARATAVVKAPEEPAPMTTPAPASPSRRHGRPPRVKPVETAAPTPAAQAANAQPPKKKKKEFEIGRGGIVKWWNGKK